MGKLKRLDLFDAQYFGLAENAVDDLDPQIRIVHETTCEAIMDAGIDPEELRGSNTGIYVGCCDYDTESAHKENDSNPTAFPQHLFGRISHAFDFHGPICMTDTACASSFTAMNEAVRAVRAGVCDQAIVNGISIHVSPFVSLSYHVNQMTAQAGKSKSLDASADGYVRAETVVSVLIQRRSKAKRIYATVVNTKTNIDGYKLEGLTYPRMSAQRDLMIAAYREAGIDPTKLTYMEAHLTGTPAGDPVESQAIMEATCQGRTKPLLVGAMKSNMGHSEGASGLAAVTKACLAFQHDELPPNIHYKSPNPAIEGLKTGVLKPVIKRTPFYDDLIGLNSFGIGGVNVHTILGANKKRLSTSDVHKLPLLVPVCGRTTDGLHKSIDYIEKNKSKVNTEFVALAVDAFKIRPTPSGMNTRGYALLHDDKCMRRVVSCKEKKPLWLVFSGFGSQWPAMAKALMPIKTFADSIHKCNKIAAELGVDLMPLLLDETFNNTHAGATFVAIASVQIALVDLLYSLDLRPDGIVAHSAGEVGAAYADGAIDARQALHCGLHMAQTPVDLMNGKDGIMVTTDLTWEEATKRCPPGVYPACHNGQESVTVSGYLEDVKPFVETLKAEGRMARKVESNGGAYHCPASEPARSKIRDAILPAIPEPKRRSAKWISSTAPDASVPLADAAYFANLAIEPVRFAETFAKIPRNALLVEVGPHPQLLSLLKRGLGANASCVPLIKRNNNDQNLSMLFAALGEVYCCGENVSLSNVYPRVEWPVSRNTLSISPMIQWVSV